VADREAPKYLNSPGTEIYEKSRVLYGLSFARNAVQRRDRLIVVEGYFDAVSLWQAGFEEAVAPCGTALTAEQLEVVRRLTGRVIALFDTDEAGLSAAVRSLDLFLAAGIEARRLDLPGAKDPDEFVQKFGGAAFEERLGRTEPLVELVIRRTLDRHGPSAEGRGRGIEALVPTLRRLEGPARDATLARLAGWTGVAEDEVRRLVGRTNASPAVASPQPPDRWAPDLDLAHLLWLAVHFPAELRAPLFAIDPSLVTDRTEVMEGLARLVDGEALAEAIRWAEDDAPHLARVLTRAAAHHDLYRLETAQAAARAVLARMELRGVEARILTINREIHRCETTGDKSSYGELLRSLAGLHARRGSLVLIVARRTGTE
jgi:DNA primase